MANGIKATAIGSMGSDFIREDQLVLVPPSLLTYHRFLHKSAEDGASVAILECTSIGIEQQRMEGVTFDLIVFTSFSFDHTGYHGNLLKYFLAKLDLVNYLKPNGSILFKNIPEYTGVFNNFSSSYKMMLCDLPVMTESEKESLNNMELGKHQKLNHNIMKITSKLERTENIFLKNNKEEITITDEEGLNGDKSLCLIIKTPDGENKVIHDLFDDFNCLMQINNFVMAFSAFYMMESKLPKITISSLPKIGGRFSYVQMGNLVSIVDYCHNIEKFQYFWAVLQLAIKYGSLYMLKNRKIVVVPGVSNVINEVMNRLGSIKWLIQIADYIVITRNTSLFHIDTELLEIGKNKEIEIMEDREEAVKKVVEKYGNKHYIMCFLTMGEGDHLCKNGRKYLYNELEYVTSLIQKKHDSKKSNH